MKFRSQRGFTLVEFVIAIVFVGVVLGPLLVFVTRIHDLNNAIGQQGRREAWHSFTDAAVAAGIDPAAPALTRAVNAAVPAVAALPVDSGTVETVPGIARIVPLRVVIDGTIAEPRVAGAGFQIGGGGILAPRGVPQAPLKPIVMPTPSVTPLDGTVIAATALAASADGGPYTLDVVASSPGGVQVHATFNQPHDELVGLGSVARRVSAVDLLSRVNGLAWSEFAGNATGGDRAVQLGDGRTRWLVTTAENRLQIYEPSPVVRFGYRIGLGTPVVVQTETETTSGGQLSFDYAGYLAVQSRTSSVKIDFPAAVKRAFGTSWPVDSIGFQWTFQSVAGPFSGDAQAFFQASSLALWTDAVPVVAVAVVPEGALAEPATWTFARLKSALGVPLLASAADDTGFFAPGQVEFSAPRQAAGTQVGRLSFDNGTTVSTGPSLSIAVTP